MGFSSETIRSMAFVALLGAVVGAAGTVWALWSSVVWVAREVVELAAHLSS